MSLAAGTRVGPYEVLSLLGAGGMGEVYRARDTKLNRHVALKLLPEAFARDSDRLARLEREARTLAALNHPNIAHVHGLEESGTTRALVMELVEGEDLAHRLERGAIPMEEALPIAEQIARALEAAHERGIVHRDLKPANVKLAPDGTVKVLDFGLAKGFQVSRPQPGASDAGARAPTFGAPSTETGLIFGTASYMAPEQARGLPVDKRADIWSFGCLFYEMLTGARLFAGNSASDILAAVLRQEIDWAPLPAETPAAIRRLLARCLVRDPRRRLRDIGDALFDIEAAHVEGAAAARPLTPGLTRRSPLWPAAAVVAAAAGIAAGWILRGPATPPSPATRFEVRLPAGHTLFVGLEAGLAVAPDGQRLAIGGFTRDAAALLVQGFNEFESHVVPGSQNGISPFFSPDGEWVGFFTMDGTLKKVRVGGGEPLVICPAPQSRTGTWLQDHSIVFDSPTGLMRVSDSGGTPSRLTTVAPAKGEIVHWAPRSLAGTRMVLFTVHGREGSRIGAVSIDGGPHREVLEGTTPIGVVSGYLLHGRGSAIVATPFDADRLTATGTPIPVINDIRRAGPRVLADMTPGGTLAYQPAFSREAALVWVDRAGNVTPTPAPRGAYDAPRLSPDNRRAAVAIADGDKTDVWVIDLDRGTRIRVTNDGRSRSPLWLPDGQRILVTSAAADGRSTLLAVSADGSAAPQTLPAPERLLHVDSVSPDGTMAITEQPFEAVPRLSLGRGRVLLVPMAAEGSQRSLLPTAADARNAVFSPNGRWIAYVSEESGTSHVYLQPADGGGANTAVSTSMGWQPVWSRDGRELYYRGSNRIMRATIDAATGKVSPPSELFDSPFTSFRGADFFRAQYDVTPDGRFLMVQSAGPGDQVRVILSVQTELARLAGSAGRGL